MQLSLFDGDANDQCAFPFLAASSGYRYGCRCPRCRESLDAVLAYLEARRARPRAE